MALPTVNNLKYDPKLLENAQKESKTLLRLEINGHFVKQGCMQMTKMMGPKTTKKLWDLVNKILVDEQEALK